MSESESKNSDIAISRPKKKNTEEESGSDSKGLNIELEQFFPSFGIKETIFISDNESEDESKENINFFFSVNQVADIIILHDSS